MCTHQSSVHHSLSLKICTDSMSLMNMFVCTSCPAHSEAQGPFLDMKRQVICIYYFKYDPVDKWHNGLVVPGSWANKIQKKEDVLKKKELVVSRDNGNEWRELVVSIDRGSSQDGQDRSS